MWRKIFVYHHGVINDDAIARISSMVILLSVKPIRLKNKNDGMLNRNGAVAINVVPIRIKASQRHQLPAGSK